MGNSRLILVTDDIETMVLPLAMHLQKAGYQTITASDGEHCLQLAFEKRPDLIILDLTLPKLHGIAILRRLKADIRTQNIGIIITTGTGLFTDYQIVMEMGANYFLIKPLDFHLVIQLVKQYFDGNLHANSFPSVANLFHQEAVEFYSPQPHMHKSYLKLWGTRGSITVSGIEYHRYGGNTSCLELKYEDNLIIIDAGTGIRPLGKELMHRNIRTIQLLIGHTHWDHIIGFPFFEPAFSNDFTINFYGAVGFGKSLKDSFMSMLERDYFPVRFEEMQAKRNFYELHDDHPLQIGDLKIAVTYATHPGATLCFKIITPKLTIGYATDNEFLVGYHGNPKLITEDHPRLLAYQNMIHFFRGCDLLIHEAQYTPQEYRQKVGWGHSSIANVALLIKYCGIKNWWITHHDPEDNDEILRQKLLIAQDILAECQIDCAVDLAYDGIVFPL